MELVTVVRLQMLPSMALDNRFAKMIGRNLTKNGKQAPINGMSGRQVSGTQVKHAKVSLTALVR